MHSCHKSICHKSEVPSLQQQHERNFSFTLQQSDDIQMFNSIHL